MRRQDLRRSVLAQLLHSIPEVHRGLRIVAALRHHHESDVVCLCFVFARRRHGEEEIDDHFAGVEGNVKRGESYHAKEYQGGLGYSFTVVVLLALEQIGEGSERTLCGVQ